MGCLKRKVAARRRLLGLFGKPGHGLCFYGVENPREGKSLAGRETARDSAYDKHSQIDGSNKSSRGKWFIFK